MKTSLGCLIYTKGSLISPDGSPTTGSEKDFVVIVPRNEVFVDKVTLPKIALENGYEVARFQAEKLFKETDLSARLIPISQTDDSVECLIIAIKEEILESIKDIAREKKLRVLGVTFASLLFAKAKGIESGKVTVEWPDGAEIAFFIRGSLRDIFFIPQNADYNFPAEGSTKITPLDIANLDMPSQLEDILIFHIDLGRKKRRININHILASVAILLTIALSLQANTYIKQKKKLEKLTSKISTIRKELAEINKLQDEVKKLKENVEEVQSLFKSIDPIDVIYRLSQALPEDTKVRYLNIKGNTVSLRAYTSSASKAIESLGKMKSLGSLKIISAPSKAKGGVYKGLERFGVRFVIEDEKLAKQKAK